MAPRWRKVLAGLWANKIRTVLVVLSIAVGVFAVGINSSVLVTISHDMDVMERTREIGVLRSIGASNDAVMKLVLVVVVLSTFASILPAWNAVRLTVREVLAYE